MAPERARGSSLRSFLWTEAKLERRAKLVSILEANPLLSRKNDLSELSRKDFWQFRVRQCRELIRLKFEHGWERQDFLEATMLVGDVLPATFQFRST